MSSPSREDNGWFTYASFLASSARAGLEESVVVSSHRLVEAIRRLLLLVPDLKEDVFFRDIDALLNDGFTKAYFKSPEEFTAFLEELLRRFAVEARTRSGLS